MSSVRGRPLANMKVEEAHVKSRRQLDYSGQAIEATSKQETWQQQQIPLKLEKPINESCSAERPLRMRFKQQTNRMQSSSSSQDQSNNILPPAKHKKSYVNNTSSSGFVSSVAIADSIVGSVYSQANREYCQLKAISNSKTVAIDETARQLRSPSRSRRSAVDICDEDVQAAAAAAAAAATAAQKTRQQGSRQPSLVSREMRPTGAARDFSLSSSDVMNRGHLRTEIQQQMNISRQSRSYISDLLPYFSDEGVKVYRRLQRGNTKRTQLRSEEDVKVRGGGGGRGGVMRVVKEGIHLNNVEINSFDATAVNRQKNRREVFTKSGCVTPPPRPRPCIGGDDLSLKYVDMLHEEEEELQHQAQQRGSYRPSGSEMTASEEQTESISLEMRLDELQMIGSTLKKRASSFASANSVTFSNQLSQDATFKHLSQDKLVQVKTSPQTKVSTVAAANLNKEIGLDIEEIHFYAVDFNQNCKQWLNQIERAMLAVNLSTQ